MNDDTYDLNHVRHGLRTLDDSLEQWIKEGRQLQASLRGVGKQMDKLISKEEDY